MSETLGKLHWAVTFAAFHAVFFPMHMLGMAGLPRRYADPYIHPPFEHLLGLNQFMTYAAIVMGFAQFLLVANFFGSWLFGRKAGRNPWLANGLEWECPQPAAARELRPAAGLLPAGRTSIPRPSPCRTATTCRRTSRPIMNPAARRRLGRYERCPCPNAHGADAPRSPWPHRAAWTLVLCTVVGTVGLGATVTTLGAGMAFLDWPTSGGENMLAYNFFHDIKVGATDKVSGARPPPRRGGDRACWRSGWRRRCGSSTAGGGRGGWGWRCWGWSIVQGLAGGLRVTEISTTLAMLHGHSRGVRGGGDVRGGSRHRPRLAGRSSRREHAGGADGGVAYGGGAGRAGVAIRARGGGAALRGGLAGTPRRGGAGRSAGGRGGRGGPWRAARSS